MSEAIQTIGFMVGTMETCRFLGKSTGAANTNNHRQNLLWVVMAAATAFVATLIYSAVWIVEWYQKEPIVRYELVTPTKPEESRILEPPSIKV